MQTITFPQILGVLGVMLILAFAGLFILSRNHMKKLRIDRDEHVKEIVSDILEQCGWSSRQRWVSDSAIEFVYLVLGRQSPAYSLIWARVHIERNQIKVNVEYASDASRDVIPFAEAVAQEFKSRGIGSETIESFSHPKPEELGVTGSTLSTLTA